MGLPIITLYALDEARVARVVGSASAPIFEQLRFALEEYPRSHLRALVYGTYERSTAYEAAIPLLATFRGIVRKLAEQEIGVAMEDDRDAAPLVWEWVWMASPGCDPFELPRAPGGLPAVAFRSWATVRSYLDRFQAARRRGELPPELVPASSLDHLVGFLESTIDIGLGIYVFR